MNSTDLTAWATRHGVSPAAFRELVEMACPDCDAMAGSEMAVQNAVRLEASRKGLWLGRNNVGALQDERGRWVRFGLANDSKQMNRRIKSADLIGLRPGGQFVSREVKEPGWKYTGTGREPAQLAWITLVASLGGDAAFATGEGTL